MSEPIITQATLVEWKRSQIDSPIRVTFRGYFPGGELDALLIIRSDLDSWADGAHALDRKWTVTFTPVPPEIDFSI